MRRGLPESPIWLMVRGRSAEALAIIHALVPRLGYAKVSKLARQSVNEGRSLLAIMAESGVMSEAEAMVVIEKASRPVFD